MSNFLKKLPSSDYQLRPIKATTRSIVTELYLVCPLILQLIMENAFLGFCCYYTQTNDRFIMENVENLYWFAVRLREK